MLHYIEKHTEGNTINFGKEEGGISLFMGYKQF